MSSTQTIRERKMPKKELVFADGIINKMIEYVNNNDKIPLNFKYESNVELDPERKLVWISNHSGWFAFDGFIGANSVFPELKKNYMKVTGKKEGEFNQRDILTAVVHEALKKPPISYFFPEKVLDEMLLDRREYTKMLKNKNFDSLPRNVAIFPEDERGSTKSFLQAYKLKKFKTGFLRHALATDSDIVICTTVGNEELLPNLCSVKVEDNETSSKFIFPIPLLPIINPITLTLYNSPDYKFTTHEIVSIESVRERIDNGESIDDVAEFFRVKTQEYLDKETFHRPVRVGSKFFDKFRKSTADLLDFKIEFKF